MRKHHRSASPYESRIGFSRAVRHGNRILVSGTAPIGPDGETVAGDAYAQARRCFEIIVEAIEALGGTAAGVVRTRMFLTAAEDWEAVARAHGERFRGIDPAATMVVVKELLDPRWRVEIEAEAKVEQAE
jgi:enamine deaminase RidA (YjgF/YER057c/UK114 family)